MDEIKDEMRDQPDKPVEKQVKKLCEPIPGTSGKNTKFELMDKFKMWVEGIFILVFERVYHFKNSWN